MLYKFLRRCVIGSLMAMAGGPMMAAIASMPTGKEPPRERIHMVGSSTVYRLSELAAEHFARQSGLPLALIESTGTSKGFLRFCTGVGSTTPDINNPSRRITPNELDICHRHGVKEVVELPIGYDGIVVATGKKTEKNTITRRELFLAAAARVPRSDTDCTLIPNPYRRWREIAPHLPDQSIEVFGPPASSGTRDSFIELVMLPGARSFACADVLHSQDPAAFNTMVATMRSGGHWIDGGENDEVLVNTVAISEGAVGIFGYSLLDRNRDLLNPLAIEAVQPGPASIADGQYPLARLLYIYVKREHLTRTPGLRQFIEEIANGRANAEGGYLQEVGLIPLLGEVRQRLVDISIAFDPISMSDLSDEP
jgi:phosphate transport system substrate-binding protein